MSVVLECPFCGSAFQVLPENAGQLVACPTCSESVTVPELLAAEEPEPIPMALPTKPIIFNCGSCSGKFGVTPDMDGTRVACPHCDKHVLVQIESSEVTGPVVSQSPPPSEPLIPKIKTNRKKKKKIVIADHTPPPVGLNPSTPSEPPPIPVINVKRNKKKPKTIGPRPAGPPAVKPLTVKPPTVKPPTVKPPAEEKNRESKEGRSPEQMSRTFDDSAAAARESDLLPPVKSKQAGKTKPKPVSKTKSKTKSKKPSAPKQKTKKEVQKAEKSSGSETAKSTEPTEREHVEKNKVVENSAAGKRKNVADAARIDRRLPPKFTVEDPDGDEYQTQSNLPTVAEHEVILPDGEGGYNCVDSRVVRVERNGEILELKAPTKESRAFNRMIQNLFSIGLGILILLLAFWILIAW